MNEWGTIAAIVGAVAAPVGAYFLAARKMSGRVDTTEAEELWEESRDMRKEYRNQVAAAETRIAELEARIEELEARIAELQTSGPSSSGS